MTRDRDLKKLFRLIRKVKICMMTTVDPDGQLRSRPMVTQTKYGEPQLWFFTKRSAPKVDEVELNGQVNLAYADPDSNTYVSISGRGSMVTNRWKMKELWNPAYRAWFPEGLDDPSLGLLKVAIEKAEYWQSPSSLAVHILGFTKAILSGKMYRPGAHQKFEVMGARGREDGEAWAGAGRPASHGRGSREVRAG
jgi:general stress protein 26